MENPYQAPQAASHTPLPLEHALDRSDRVFKSIAGISKFLIGLYFFHLLSCVVGVGVTCFGMTVTQADLQAEPMAPNAQTYIALIIGYGIAHLLLFITTAVIHCIWTYRASNNTEALGARGKQFTPGWSVGWFFIPFANLIQPHKVACEIYNSSTPGSDGREWKQKASPSFLGWWWGLYILSGMLTNVSNRLTTLPDAGTVRIGEWIAVAAEVVALISAWLAIKYVRGVAEKQTQPKAAGTSHTDDVNPFAMPKPSRQF